MQVGERHHRLVAVEKSSSEKWLFRCDCGTEKQINARNVARGVSQSCGCLHRERLSARRRSHGHSTGGKITPEFQAYRSMMARCYRPSNNRFESYGGRGITVCDRWHGSFEAFLEDMGPRPSPNHSLDRERNHLGYSLENCRWATRKQQMRNRRSNLLVQIGNETVTLIEASERSGVPYETLKVRIFKNNWPHDRALTKPVRRMTRRPKP